MFDTTFAFNNYLCNFDTTNIIKNLISDFLKNKKLAIKIGRFYIFIQHQKIRFFDY